MRQYQWIEANPQVMMGKPVFKGTRIPIDLALEKLAAGETIEQILESHPRLTPEAIQAEEYRQRMLEEQHRADKERKRAERLAQRLRELGVEPEEE